MWLVLHHPACTPLASTPTLQGVLSKRLGRVDRRLMTQPVLTRPGQRVRHCLVGHCPVGLGLLPLVIARHCQGEPPGAVGRFRRGPGQRRVAMFAVALALPCAIADVGAVDTATRRGIVSYPRQASDVARCQEARLGEHRPDPIDRLPPRIPRCPVYPGPDACGHRLALLGQAVQHRQSTADRQGLLRVRSKRITLGLTHALDPIGTQTRARVAHKNVLHAQDIGRLLRDQRGALAHDIADGPLGFRINVARREHPYAEQVR